MPGKSSPGESPEVRVVVVMGVSGVGKTTIGRLLAKALGWVFYDGDDFHPPENRHKMASGVPLGDADRLPWLAEIRSSIDLAIKKGPPAVVACSALKASYREVLLGGTSEVRLVNLDGSFETIAARLRTRRGHFMPPELLQSQFDALEEPRDALVVDVGRSPSQIVEEIMAAL